MVDIPFTQSDSEVEVGVPYAKISIYSTIFYLRLVDIKIFNSETLLCLKFCICFIEFSIPRWLDFQSFNHTFIIILFRYNVRKHTKSNSNHLACMVYLKAIYNIIYLFSSIIITPFNHQFQNQNSKVSHIILFCWNYIFLGDCGLMVWFYAELYKLLTIFTNELVVYNNDNFKLFYFPNLNTVLRTLANWNFSFNETLLVETI